MKLCNSILHSSFGSGDKNIHFWHQHLAAQISIFIKSRLESDRKTLFFIQNSWTVRFEFQVQQPLNFLLIGTLLYLLAALNLQIGSKKNHFACSIITIISAPTPFSQIDWYTWSVSVSVCAEWNVKFELISDVRTKMQSFIIDWSH